MARVSGLGTAVGIAQEVTPGTAVTPSRWLDVREESLRSTPVTYSGGGLRSGALYARSSNETLIGHNVEGGWTQDISTRGMGLLFKNMLGAGSSAVLTGTAYRQIFTPADITGLSMTVQKILGGTNAFSYNGAKFKSWRIGVETGGGVSLGVEIDAWDEKTPGAGGLAAGTPSYTAAIESFNFKQGEIIVGGTASTSSGLTTLTGGTTVGIVRSAEITGSRPLTEGNDNRAISTAGKVEQDDNGWLTAGGTLTAFYDSAFDFYALYKANTATALKLTFTTTATAITGSTYPSLEILLPDVRFRGETPQAGGPESLMVTAPFEALQDTVNSNPAVQIVTVTADTTIS